MEPIELRNSVLEYIKNEADHRFLKLVNAMALSYSKKKSSDRVSIEEYNKELEKAEKDIENGNCYTQEEVEKIAKQWGR